MNYRSIYKRPRTNEPRLVARFSSLHRPGTRSALSVMDSGLYFALRICGNEGPLVPAMLTR